jgi:hypothetical protein
MSVDSGAFGESTLDKLNWDATGVKYLQLHMLNK